MVIRVDARAVQSELGAVSSAMAEVTRLMGPQIWQGGSAAAFTTDLQGHNRSLNRMMREIIRTVVHFNRTPSNLELPTIPGVTPATGRPGVASVSPNGLERLETALNRAADRLPQSGKMIRGLLAVVYPDIPSTAACDRTASWCRDQASRMRTRIMYALAENQVNPVLLISSPLSPVPDTERFGAKEMTDLGRLQALAWNKTRSDPTASTPELISEITRTLRANTKDEGYLNAFFNNVPKGSMGKLAYDLHRRHGGSGLTPEDKKTVGDIGTALASLSRTKNGQAAVANALGPIGADMPGQALLVRLSAPNVKWSSAVLADMARAALRWRQQYPSYVITRKVIIDHTVVRTAANQPDHRRWWNDWDLDPSGDPSDLRPYDPALNVLGRISQQQDLTAARTLAATNLESAFSIKDAEKADALTWLTRGNGGTYASLLTAPDWPDGGKAAGSVIALATTPERGHEKEAALNAAEIMKTVAWWNDKGREKLDKDLRQDGPPDLLPWFDILPSQSETAPGMAHTKHYAAELGPGLQSGLLTMTRMHIPMIADADASSAGSGLPNRDHATGRTYVDIGGQDVQQFLRTFAADDRSWTQIAMDTQKFRQLLFTWGLRDRRWPTAQRRAGQMEGNLIAAFGKERLTREALTQQQYDEAKKHLGVLRDLGATVLGSTQVGAVPGVTDAYTMGTDLALDKIKYAPYEKKVQQIHSAYSNYSDQLYLDLARAIRSWKGEHTGDPQLDRALKEWSSSPEGNSQIIKAVKDFIVSAPKAGPVTSGEDLIATSEGGSDHNTGHE